MLSVVARRSLNLARPRVVSALATQGRSYNYGTPVLWIVRYDDPTWDAEREHEYELIPRDEFGVPVSLPPEVSTNIRHTYYVPPQYYPFLKKLGDDTPELKPYTDKLMNGQMTFFRL